MNLRILKKLSKRAAPLLPLLGYTSEQFRAAHENTGENFLKTAIRDQKNWERRRSKRNEPWHGEIVRPAKDGNGYIILREPNHPRKGTIMVGSVSGYYEPELDEETAWCALQNIVLCHFTDWSLETPKMTRRLRTPSEIFAAAHEIIIEMRGQLTCP